MYVFFERGQDSTAKWTLAVRSIQSPALAEAGLAHGFRAPFATRYEPSRRGRFHAQTTLFFGVRGCIFLSAFLPVQIQTELMTHVGKVEWLVRSKTIYQLFPDRVVARGR